MKVETAEKEQVVAFLSNPNSGEQKSTEEESRNFDPLKQYNVHQKEPDDQHATLNGPHRDKPRWSTGKSQI